MGIFLSLVLFSQQSDLLTCEEGFWILDGIAKTELSAREKDNLNLEILVAMPDNCQRDKDNPRRK